MRAIAEPPVDSPRTLADAYALLRGDPPPRPIAGGTDLLVQLSAGVGEPPASVLDLSNLADLRGIALTPDALVIGAMTTYADLRRSPLVHDVAPALAEAAALVGAAQIQNRGTIGGNLANASPAGDLLPVLLALDADVVLGGPRGERSVAAGDFFTDYRQTALAPDELILRICVPIVPGRRMQYRKVGTRRAQAISKVALVLAWRESDDAGPAGPAAPWRDVRVALASVAAVPIRATATEAVLEGARPTPEVADRAAEALAAELQPIDDVRSTADYRRTVAARILHRMLREAGGW